MVKKIGSWPRPPVNTNDSCCWIWMATCGTGAKRRIFERWLMKPCANFPRSLLAPVPCLSPINCRISSIHSTLPILNGWISGLSAAPPCASATSAFLSSRSTRCASLRRRQSSRTRLGTVAGTWRNACIYIYISIYLSIYIYLFIYLFIYVYLFNTYTHTYIYIHIYTYIHIYVYTYIHIYIYTYIHIYIYT